MKFSSKIKVEVGASKDQGRPVLTHVHYNHAAHRLEACDGFIGILLPVTDDEQDEDMLVPVAAITTARKAAKNGDCEIFCQNKKIGCKGVFWEAGEGVYPDIQQIMPKVEGKPPFFSIDLALLRRLADALGGGNTGVMVKLKRTVIDSAVQVDFLNDDSGAVGVIMSVASVNEKVVNDGLTEAPEPTAPKAKLTSKRARAKKAK
jgi:DNA polymerase III sliding clamp (beta) subunit (PCNA family)